MTGAQPYRPTITPDPNNPQAQPSSPNGVAVDSASAAASKSLGEDESSAAATTTMSLSSRLPRLRSAASFGAFRPRALACRTAITPPSNRVGNSEFSSGETFCQSCIAAVAGPLGVAVFHVGTPYKPYLVLNHASPDSRRVSTLAFQPPAVSTAGASGGDGSMLLAAGGGNGVMIWDASGRALSPLVTRLTCCDATAHDTEGGIHSTLSSSSSMRGAAHPSSSGRVGVSVITSGGLKSSPSGPVVSSWDEVTCVAWKGCGTTESSPLLVTSSSRNVSLWDLRCPHHRSTSRPVLRYASIGGGGSRMGLAGSAPSTIAAGLSSSLAPTLSASPAALSGQHRKGSFPFVHVACEAGPSFEKVAAMDAGGIVRVFDDRYASSSSSSSHSGCSMTTPLGAFVAHDRVGVGISSITGGGWITWGGDASVDTRVDADISTGFIGVKRECVKLWKECEGDGTVETVDEESYWYMGEETGRIGTGSGGRCGGVSYEMVSNFASPHGTFCARVCPGLFSDAVVTVGPASSSYSLDDTSRSSWRADIWLMDRVGTGKGKGTWSGSGSGSGSDNACRKIGSFCAGGADDLELMEMIAGENNGRGNGNHNAAGHPIATELAVGTSPVSPEASELLVCSLSSCGYLTTYSVPEVFASDSRSFSPTVEPIAASPPLASSLSPARSQSQHYHYHPHVIRPIQSTMLPTGRVFRQSTENFLLPGEETMGTGTIASKGMPMSPQRLSPDKVSSLGCVGNRSVDGTSSSSIALRTIHGGDMKSGMGGTAAMTSMTVAAGNTWSGGAENKSPSWSVLPPPVSPDLRPLDGSFTVPTSASGSAADPLAAVARGLDGVTMQFELDGPVPSAQTIPAASVTSSSVGDNDDDELRGGVALSKSSAVPPPDFLVGAATGGSGAGIAAVGPGAAVGGGQSKPVMVGAGGSGDLLLLPPPPPASSVVDRKKRDSLVDASISLRMPCPRLCGAKFGRGPGGLVLFHNGEVRKMWSWFREISRARNDATTACSSSSAHRGRRDDSFASLFGDEDTNGGGSTGWGGNMVEKQEGGNDHQSQDHEAVQPPSDFRDTPRTMHDLKSMNTAAKIAQWGEDVDANRDSGESGDEDSMLDSSSEESSDNGSDDEEEDAGGENEDESDNEGNRQDTPMGSVGGASNNRVAPDTNATSVIEEKEEQMKREEKDGLYHDYFSKSDYLRPHGASFRSRRETVSTKAIAVVGGAGSGSGGDRNHHRDEGNADPFAGPSSDPLAPAVILTRKHDGIVMNGQCPELADGFELGDWWLWIDGFTSTFLPSDPSHRTAADGDWGWGYDDFGEANGNVEHQGSDGVDIDTASFLHRHQSVPVLHRTGSEGSSSNHQQHRNKSDPDRFQYVLGRHDSMMENLKRLFSHQRQGNLTPPDQSFADLHSIALANSNDFVNREDIIMDKGRPLSSSSLSLNPEFRRSSSSSALLQSYHTPSSIAHMIGSGTNPRGNVDGAPADRAMTTNALRAEEQKLDHVGVYTLALPFPTTTNTNLTRRIGEGEEACTFAKQISRTKQLCLHNSSVCYSVGQSEKGDVWTILAQVVDNLVSDSFFRDSPKADGALGRDLVSNLFRYYEALGDVQMLATMVCVLSCGRDRRMINNVNGVQTEHQGLGTDKTLSSFSRFGLNSLLPADDMRYDNYIHLYSSLLYDWGQLSVRTELGKHLRHSIPGAGGETIQLKMAAASPKRVMSNSNNPEGKKHVVVPNHGVSPGISLAPLCPRCHRPAIADTNVCKVCKDYAFRCSICTNAVRGLFTTCLSCGHGGHFDHILDWFSRSHVCPSGCGCNCVFNTFAPPIAASSSEGEEKDKGTLAASGATNTSDANKSQSTTSSSSTWRGGDTTVGGAGRTLEASFSGAVSSLPFGAYDSQKLSMQVRSGGGGGNGGRKSKSLAPVAFLQRGTVGESLSSQHAARHSYRKKDRKEEFSKLRWHHYLR